jgi:hypothetical protein
MDLSEEHVASIFKSEEQACHLFLLWFLAWLIFSTLKMGATCSSEKSVKFQPTTRRYITKDTTLHNHRCENLKAYMHSAY